MFFDISTLTSRIVRGEEEAFEQFYELYSSRLLRYLFALTRGDEAIAKDVHQEAMLKVVRHMRTFESEEALWNWLARVGKNTLIDFLRKRQSEASFLLAEEENVDAPCAKESEERLLDRMLDYLRSALGELTSDERELIEAYYFHGETQLTLASEADVTPKALGMRFSRIRMKLKSLISGRLMNE